MIYSARGAGIKYQEQRNPAWLIALPIVDFLDGSLKPFDTLDYGNFQDKEDEWWLRNEFEIVKEDLKRYEWSRYLIKRSFMTYYLFNQNATCALIY